VTSKLKKKLKPEDELRILKKALKADHLVNLADTVAQARQTVIGAEIQASQSIDNTLATKTSLVFDGAPFDSSGFYQGPGSTQIVVPVNAGGRYNLVLWTRWEHPIHGEFWTADDAHNGYFYSVIDRNGQPINEFRRCVNPTIGARGTTHNTSWYVALKPGDTLEIKVQHNAHPNPVHLDAAICLMRLGVGTA
jgi:hypothetical protein